MKRKILLLSAVCLSVGAAQAQIKAYAITGSQKGSANWSEVRLIDVATGDELQTIYKNTQEIEKLNARTGKAIVKKDPATTNVSAVAPTVTVYRTDGDNKMVIVRKSAPHATLIQSDAPFATSSAALAYDKKHDRLYYTPMGINELRYIDMKSKTTKVYYFENESFGALKSRGDVPNQITRMVIGSDGKGYALSNNAEHLIQFETDKKPEVKDLGSLNDDPTNGVNSIHSTGNYGGDMIADAFGNLYLVGANAKVFKIEVKTMTATYKGRIKGLPAGFTTNGAAVEKDGEGSVVVCSSTSTNGYYRFDLQSLQAEKASSGETVFNASDLANGFLAYSKKNKPEEPKQPVAVIDEPAKVNQPNTSNTTTASPQNTVTTAQRGTPQQQQLVEGTISVYPNPVTTGITRVSFKDYVSGKYQVQLMDISGKLLSTQTVNVNNKLQVEELRLPQYIAKGSYRVKVLNEENKVVGVNQIIVQ